MPHPKSPVKNALFYLLLTIPFFILALPIILLGYLGFTPPQKFDSPSLKTHVLTNTRLIQLQKLELFDLLLSENASNPYIFGWDGNVLYYKDKADHHWRFDPTTGKKTQAKPPREQLLKQVRQVCQLPPPAGELPKQSPILYKPESTAYCQRYEQAGTIVENWAYYAPNGSIWFTENFTYVQFPEQNAVLINEKRGIRDIAISENGAYIAILATGRCGTDTGSRCTFDPNDVFVIEYQ